MVGVLRRDTPAHSPSARLSPQPGLGELDDLMERMRATGLPVRVEVHGDPRPLAPGLDLAAFRIVQEALTNTRKHAGPASARVALRYAGGELCIQVVDDGRGAAGRLDRDGRST
ncbi:MAG TPA: sensor histidine kinase, partial [Frankiaceae bacterium]|nr:sensor histidine kinase [Frankiaceae bacterium]